MCVGVTLWFGCGGVVSVCRLQPAYGLKGSSYTATFCCLGSWWGNGRKRDNWGDLGVDGWIMLRWISRRWDVGIWTGLGCPRIGTGGGRL